MVEIKKDCIDSMKIDSILMGMEDKTDNPSTTSKKFKKDLWNFCTLSEHINLDINLDAAVEFGTHKGQTTAILSELFKTVYTFNLPGHFSSAMEFNQNRTNIQYVGWDLYSGKSPEIEKSNAVSLVFSDAVHQYNAVVQDVENAKNWFRLSNPCYFVFDDYGAWDDVKRAVDDMIKYDTLELVTKIGHHPGWTFSDRSPALKDWEGIICKLK